MNQCDVYVVTADGQVYPETLTKRGLAASNSSEPLSEATLTAASAELEDAVARR